jgi:hypothetical protein
MAEDVQPFPREPLAHPGSERATMPTVPVWIVLTFGLHVDVGWPL